MFYQHLAVPFYIKEEVLAQLEDCDVQVVGDLTQLSEQQKNSMNDNGFWPDTSNYLLLNRGDQTLAWLGFARHRHLDVVTVRQIQGRRNYPDMPKGWPKFLLRSFIESLDRDYIHTVRVLPARLSVWWPELDDREELRQRLLTYYDWIPKRLGFALADKELVEQYANLPRFMKLCQPPTTPHHTLRLGR